MACIIVAVIYRLSLYHKQTANQLRYVILPDMSLVVDEKDSTVICILCYHVDSIGIRT